MNYESGGAYNYFDVFVFFSYNRQAVLITKILPTKKKTRTDEILRGAKTKHMKFCVAQRNMCKFSSDDATVAQW